MAWFMKFDGVDGEFSHADRFDFSQLTTEPTEPLTTAFPASLAEFASLPAM